MSDKEYLDRLVKYGKKILAYMNSVKEFHEFSSNSEKVDAVILNLEQIGETAKKISEESKAQYPNLNWQSIIGLRNMISHEYEGINLQIIYDIATEKIYYLCKYIEGEII
jgi:uncharacterized protein with HEPN domain